MFLYLIFGDNLWHGVLELFLSCKFQIIITTRQINKTREKIYYFKSNKTGSQPVSKPVLQFPGSTGQMNDKILKQLSEEIFHFLKSQVTID